MQRIEWIADVVVQSRLKREMHELLEEHYSPTSSELRSHSWVATSGS